MDIMSCDQIGCSNDVHQLGRQILQDAVDGIEVGEILLPELGFLFGCDIFADGFFAAPRSPQKDEGEVLEVFVDVEFLGVLVYLLFVLQHQVDKQIAVIQYSLRPDLSIQSMI